MLKKLSIQNFKAFGDSLAQIPLSRLTILLGPNGSGKTAVLEVLGLLSQTAARQDNQSGFVWKGKWADFGGDGKAAVNKGNLDTKLMLGLTFDPDEDANAWYSEYSERMNVQLTPPAGIEYLVANQPRARWWSQTCTIDGSRVAFSEFKPGPGRHPTLEFRVPEIKPNSIFGPGAYPDSLFNGQLFSIASQQNLSEYRGDVLHRIQQEFSAAVSYLREWLSRKVFLLGPNRLPQAEKQNPRKRDLLVGRSGEDTLNLLTYLFASAEHAEATDRVRHWASVFKLPGLKAGWVRHENLHASFTDSETRTPLDLQHSGFGSQQVLPVITQIFAAPKGSVIGIEEPEISLHPEAQLDLMRLFADGIAFGQQIILTTHSSTLPLALSGGEQYGLTPTDVTVYHLKRDSTGVTPEQLELNRNWSIPGWIPSFSSVEQKLLKEWIQKVDIGRG